MASHNRHHHHHGSIVALTPTPMIMHQHYLLQIIELNPQTGSVVLRVRESLVGYSTYTDKPIPLISWV